MTRLWLELTTFRSGGEHSTFTLPVGIFLMVAFCRIDVSIWYCQSVFYSALFCFGEPLEIICISCTNQNQKKLVGKIIYNIITGESSYER